jgi:hypothetical protein
VTQYGLFCKRRRVKWVTMRKYYEKLSNRKTAAGISLTSRVTSGVIYRKYIPVLGYEVAQLVEALRYKPAGRGFDYRWCEWKLSLK